MAVTTDHYTRAGKLMSRVTERPPGKLLGRRMTLR